jgi:hypothetical protein
MLVVASLGTFASAQGPGKEHAELKKLEGKWTAVMKMEGGEFEAKCDFKMVLGGMWLESTMEADLGGLQFTGKGLDSYDPVKQEYTAVWVDSMNGAPMLMTGKKVDNVMTLVGEGPGPSGVAKYKSVTTYETADKMNFQMFTVDGDTETEMMTVIYTRKK